MPNPQFQQAIKHLNSGQLERAEALCRKSLSTGAGDVNMQALLGTILLRSGRADEAETLLTSVIKHQPEFAKPQQELATLYMRQQQYAAAEPLFRRLTTLQPASSSAWLGLAHALKKLGRDAEAEVAGRRSMALANRPPELAEAEALLKRGKLVEARAVVSRYLASNDSDVEALRLAAIINAEDGRLSETERLLR